MLVNVLKVLKLIKCQVELILAQMTGRDFLFQQIIDALLRGNMCLGYCLILLQLPISPLTLLLIGTSGYINCMHAYIVFSLTTSRYSYSILASRNQFIPFAENILYQTLCAGV